jgi:hypothetical protein
VPRVSSGGGRSFVGYPRVSPGRIAQRESARFTRGRSLVRSQVRPSASRACSANPQSSEGQPGHPGRGSANGPDLGPYLGFRSSDP